MVSSWQRQLRLGTNPTSHIKYRWTHNSQYVPCITKKLFVWLETPSVCQKSSYIIWAFSWGYSRSQCQKNAHKHHLLWARGSGASCVLPPYQQCAFPKPSLLAPQVGDQVEDLTSPYLQEILGAGIYVIFLCYISIFNKHTLCLSERCPSPWKTKWALWHGQTNPSGSSRWNQSSWL